MTVCPIFYPFEVAFYLLYSYTSHFQILWSQWACFIHSRHCPSPVFSIKCLIKSSLWEGCVFSVICEHYGDDCRFDLWRVRIVTGIADCGGNFLVRIYGEEYICFFIRLPVLSGISWVGLSLCDSISMMFLTELQKKEKESVLKTAVYS